MERSKAFLIAKEVYQIRKKLIKEMKLKYPDVSIDFYYDDAIEVDEYLFYCREFREPRVSKEKK